MAAPGAPIVLNGVVFAASAAAMEGSGARKGRAVLYALDASTGKELWTAATR